MGIPVHVVRIDLQLRLRSLPSYYGGYYPIEWWPSPHFELRIYRIEADWVPEYPWPAADTRGPNQQP